MQALKERFTRMTKADTESLNKPQDIEKAIKEAIEKIEGVPIEANTDRIKNFFNGKFLRGMRKEVSLIERQVSSISQSQKDVLDSLDTYMEKIRKRVEEKLESAKESLFIAILEKNSEINACLSDLTICSNKMQKKIFGMRDELQSKGSILKVTVNDFIKQFEDYRTNIISMREVDLADNGCDRIVSRIQGQISKCEFQLDKMIESNLNIGQIFTTISPEVVQVSAMDMLDFDDAMSSTTDDFEIERQATLSTVMQSQLYSLKQVTQMTLDKKILAVGCMEPFNIGLVSHEDSNELSVYDVQKWKETKKLKCSGKTGTIIKYVQEKHLLFVGMLEKNIDIFTVDTKGAMKLATTIQTDHRAQCFEYMNFINGLAVSFGGSILQIYKGPNYKTADIITVTDEDKIGAFVLLESQRLILCGSGKNGTLRYIDPQTKNVVKTCQTNSSSICLITKAEGTDNLLLGNYNGVVEMTLIKDKGLQSMLSLTYNTDEVSSIEWLLEDRLFAVTNKDEFVRFYSLKGKLVHKYKAFMEDGFLVYMQRTKQFVCVDPDMGQILVLRKSE